MPHQPIKRGDVVLYVASRLIVIRATNDARIVGCPVHCMPPDRHRADLCLTWPDSLALGLTGDVVVRCAPVIIRNARPLSVIAEAAWLLPRLDFAVEREMARQAAEDAWAVARNFAG